MRRSASSLPSTRRLAVVVQVGDAGESRRNPMLGVQAINALWSMTASEGRAGWKSRKACSTSLAWGASDLARGGTEGLTALRVASENGAS